MSPLEIFLIVSALCKLLSYIPGTHARSVTVFRLLNVQSQDSINEEVLDTVTVMSILDCARQCSRTTECGIYSFNDTDGTCQLKPHVSSTQTAESHLQTYRKTGIHCGYPPVLDHKTVTSMIPTLYPARVEYTCNIGYNRTVCSGSSLCQMNGSWSVPILKCQGHKSCAEWKKCGGADTDGEYWLYPKILNGEKVKVYCSEMNTDTPKEFITLPNTNFGVFPNTCNYHCKGERTTGCPAAAATHASHVEYEKIRIDLLSMEVDRKDKTFATGTGEMLDYAKAADCYNFYETPPTKNNLEACGPKGQFKIDSTGTGLKFSSSIIFTIEGNNGGQIIDWNDDGTVITGFCGGWCGWCTPDKIILEPNPKEVLPDGIACC